MNLIEKRIRKAGDERLFYIGEALRRGVTIETIHEWSQIDLFFLQKLKNIVEFEKRVIEHPFDREMLAKSERIGFADKTIAKLWSNRD